MLVMQKRLLWSMYMYKSWHVEARNYFTETIFTTCIILYLIFGLFQLWVGLCRSGCGLWGGSGAGVQRRTLFQEFDLWGGECVWVREWVWLNNNHNFKHLHWNNVHVASQSVDARTVLGNSYIHSHILICTCSGFIINGDPCIFNRDQSKKHTYVRTCIHLALMGENGLQSKIVCYFRWFLIQFSQCIYI